MQTFAINTLGCKVNQYESRQIRHFLQSLKLNYVPSPTEADLVVIHTCCVTQTASAKSRQYIRKAQKSNPEATANILVACARAVSRMDTKPIAWPPGAYTMLDIPPAYFSPRSRDELLKDSM